MANLIHNVGVSRHIGTYSDAIEVAPNARWLFTSGTPGITRDGKVPKDVAEQAELAWQHIIAMLDRAQMTIDDLVKVTHYLTRAEDIAAYTEVRSKFLGNARPASMLLVVPQLVRQDFLLEIEAYAAKG